MCLLAARDCKGRMCGTAPAHYTPSHRGPQLAPRINIFFSIHHHRCQPHAHSMKLTLRILPRLVNSVAQRQNHREIHHQGQFHPKNVWKINTLCEIPPMEMNFTENRPRKPKNHSARVEFRRKDVWEIIIRFFFGIPPYIVNLTENSIQRI